jgi:hypothetical protein
MNKIFTFMFYYDEPKDNYGYIDFCAETLGEAEEAFNSWAESEGCPGYTDWEVVYDYADAEYYGELYGYPEEYDGI